MIREKDKTIATRGEGYGRVNLLVECNGMYRIFSTERYSVRSQLRQLRRMNPIAKVVAFSYGEPTGELSNLNFYWTYGKGMGIEEEFNGYKADNSRDPVHYLSTYRYRTALILMNIKQFNADDSIQRDPFSNLTLAELPEGPDPERVVRACSLGRSVFVPYSEIDSDDPGDVLLRWKGKRMERTLDGETRKGYWITGSRLDK